MVHSRVSVKWDVRFMDVFRVDAKAHGGRLPEAQGTVILPAAVGGMSYYKAASVLDVPIGNVTSPLSRAWRAVESELHVREDESANAPGVSRARPRWARRRA
ncbi:hypothetical protein [Caballeronia glathei]|uniref:Uncharacterized protein n=1 Tax=Caballeronia glathei TaxID=60547 RepID=A0A069PKP8_9BURK|nr:hypothetical protein [Caballeronia glathei]KDR37896.1 hypothetical protein BG61_05880 [Caballeronia glathei]